MSPRKQEENQAPDDLDQVEALGDKARKSVDKSVAAELEENAPAGNTKAGMPAETDFTTPREDQGDQTS